MPSLEEVGIKTKIIEHNLNKLEEDFDQLRADNREARKGIYQRLTDLEKLTAHIPSPEQQDLINQATKYYKAKRDFWERLLNELVTKGALAAMMLICTSLFFYIKHLLEK